MKTSKILPWIIFGLVLVLAWMTIGGSSGYYDAPPLPPNAPSSVYLVDATNPAPPPSVSGGPAALGTSAGPGTAFSPTTSASGMGGPGGAAGGGPGGGAAGGRAAGGPSGSRKGGRRRMMKPKPPPEHRRVCIYLK